MLFVVVSFSRTLRYVTLCYALLASQFRLSSVCLPSATLVHLTVLNLSATFLYRIVSWPPGRLARLRRKQRENIRNSFPQSC